MGWALCSPVNVTTICCPWALADRRRCQSDRDVVYLQGYNDTCNENLIANCESHELETTCVSLMKMCIE